LKKKITIVGLNFYPEDTAIGLYSTQLAEYLINNNFEVEVITGFPYYPKWKINDEYLDKPKNFVEYHKGIKIIRYRPYIPENPTFLKRILLLLDFTFGAYKNSFKIKKSDLVLTVVPFTSSIIVGNRIAKKNKAKHWVHIQDFEFDAAHETKLTGKANILFRVLYKIEKNLLKKADVISTISYAMLSKLQKKVGSDKTTYLLPNWVDVDFINLEKAKRHKYLSSDKFKILYAGNIGQKQDWSLFRKIAEQLSPEEVEFVIVGDGAARKEVENSLKQLPHVHFYPPVPFDELNDLLCSADAHILCQKNEVVDTVMPSKILGMMASQKPSIIAGNRKSEVAKIMTESNGGYYFENNEIDNIVDTIRQLKANPALRETLGRNARRFVQQNFDSQKILQNFTREIRTLLSE